ncbi:unnamed protein product [Moneuplotes crassus]|uniref:Uncharacterized protein n=1 Tax=Euplotes crassus TaxID=5936 RepID=A0AAD1Y0T2_EUPCR|nr:unnamed protein product [Moneuplotes crassus]
MEHAQQTLNTLQRHTEHSTRNQNHLPQRLICRSISPLNTLIHPSPPSNFTSIPPQNPLFGSLLLPASLLHQSGPYHNPTGPHPQILSSHRINF